MGPCEFHSVRAGWLAAVAAFGWLLAATPCHAWQQYHTTQGKPMRWSVESLKHPLVLDLDDSGLSNDNLSPAAVLQATQSALLQWQQLNCPMEATEGVQAQCADGSAATRPLGIEFGSPEWRPAQAIGLGCAATAELPCATLGPNGNQITFVHAANNWPYGKGVIAMTVVSAVKSTGLIADADIAVNDAGYSFCLATCLPGQIHFGEVILHEAGHFLGLDHSADPAAVMFAKPPEVINKMGALAADDKAGACAAYPATAAARTCSPLGGTAASDSGGCGAGAAGSGWPSMGLLLAAVVGWARRRHFTAVKCHPLYSAVPGPCSAFASRSTAWSRDRLPCPAPSLKAAPGESGTGRSRWGPGRSQHGRRRHGSWRSRRSLRSRGWCGVRRYSRGN